METVLDKERLYFLDDGGELGDIIRNYDWTSGSLGVPENWPASLRTTLGIMLHSAFPMFLFWGKDLTCFYNDAFRPSLGIEGKHPAVGKSGTDVWPEVWDFIGPLINKVLTTGKAVYFEDQLVPFFRNNRLEDIYWTFSYSPAYGDDGRINGVIVTCFETTSKVSNEKKLEQSARNLNNIILKAPVAMCILRGHEYIVEIANERMFALWGKPAEIILHKPIFEGLPEARQQGFEELLHEVYTTGITHTAYGLPAELPRKGVMETIYINFVYEPFREEDGTITGIMAVANEVTAQVEAGKKLQENEQKVRAIIENAPFPIGVYTGREMRIEFVNQSIMDIWGKGNDVVGKTYAEVLPELIDQKVYNQLDEVFTTGIPFHAKNTRIDLLVNGKKQVYYFNYIFTPLYDAEGRVYGVMNTAADVTDLNEAKQKVEESEWRFRLLADSIPQLVWSANSEGRFNYHNKAVHEYFGLDAAQWQEKGWLQIVHPDEAAGNEEKWKSALVSGKEFNVHHRLKNKYGEYRWHSTRALPQRDIEGETLMWIGTSADIHEHKMFEEELTNQVKMTTEELVSSQTKVHEYTERLHAVFHYSQSGMYILKPVKDLEDEVVDFRFVITNPMFASYIGQTPEKLYGELGSKWFPGYMENGVFEMYKKTYLTGESQRIDIHYNVDNLDIFLDLQSIKMGDEVLVTFSDYTQLKKAQLQLEKYVEDLKRSNANLEDFAYAASHDMKEPIRKIHYFSDKIRHMVGNRFQAEEIRYFERMEAAAQRMGDLIDDLLSYSHVSVKPRMLDEVDLNEIIRQVLGDLEIEIEEKMAKVELDNLPVIIANRRQVQQAFQNLISNAVKFQKKAISPTLSISSTILKGADLPMNLSLDEQQRQYHVISFTDNGIGFDQENADRIFNVFTRLHGNIEYRGTGIGLSIVRKVAENHNGFVFAKSKAGEGSTFSLVFPSG
ncbi:MAG: PAS domain-containing protein [Flavisolibacter sp.]